MKIFYNNTKHMNENIIEFFSYNENDDPKKWSSSLHKFQYSGFNLIHEINANKPNIVLDLGCGYNEFKNKIDNLVGIDIANKCADVVDDFLNYDCVDNSVDVILALGSINFIDFNTVEKQVEWIFEKLKPGGLAYIRVNPSVVPGDLIKDNFYFWGEEDIWYFKNKHNFKLPKSSIIKEYPNINDFENFRYFFVFEK